MAHWTLEDALTAIQILPSIPASVLQSADVLRLGDICFVKIHTTIWMCAMPLTILDKWVENGSFKPECMAEGDYSHSMDILIALSANAKGTDLETMGIGLMVCQCKAPIGQISTIPHLIKYVCSLMEVEGQSSEPECRTFCMIMGNYGRHMAFATDPLFCTAYSLDFILKEDPAQMMFRNQQNHPVSFTADGLLVSQLLAWDCTECEYTMTTCNGSLLIPRGMQFPKDLFPEIVILHNHAAPYRDPKTGKEAPFMTVGPFTRRDMPFQGIAGDLELYTTEEVITLRNGGIFKSSSSVSQSLRRLPSLTSLGQALSSPASPKVTSHSPKIELDSSSKKQDHKSSSKSHKHPVSMAAGSSTVLEKSE